MKFVRSAGGRVVPLSYNWDEQRLHGELKKLNGVLITGGDDKLTEGGKLTKVSKSMKVVTDFSAEEMKKGRYFPVYGVCMGMEGIVIVLSQNPDALGYSDA